ALRPLPEIAGLANPFREIAASHRTGSGGVGYFHSCSIGHETGSFFRRPEPVHDEGTETKIPSEASVVGRGEKIERVERPRPRSPLESIRRKPHRLGRSIRAR